VFAALFVRYPLSHIHILFTSDHHQGQRPGQLERIGQLPVRRRACYGLLYLLEEPLGKITFSMAGIFWMSLGVVVERRERPEIRCVVRAGVTTGSFGATAIGAHLLDLASQPLSSAREPHRRTRRSISHAGKC
jgi:hypothetical protein